MSVQQHVFEFWARLPPRPLLSVLSVPVPRPFLSRLSPCGFPSHPCPLRPWPFGGWLCCVRFLVCVLGCSLSLSHTYYTTCGQTPDAALPALLAPTCLALIVRSRRWRLGSGSKGCGCLACPIVWPTRPFHTPYSWLPRVLGILPIPLLAMHADTTCKSKPSSFTNSLQACHYHGYHQPPSHHSTIPLHITTLHPPSPPSSFTTTTP